MEKVWGALRRVQHHGIRLWVVMVWGGISLEVLQLIVRPFAGAVMPDFIVMQDNARACTARFGKAYLDQEGIDVMEWPVRSLDLNPIELLWDMLQRRVSQHRPNPPQTVQNIRDALMEKRNVIDQRSMRRLIRDMPRRCRECIQARGSYTSY